MNPGSEESKGNKKRCALIVSELSHHFITKNTFMFRVTAIFIPTDDFCINIFLNFLI